MIESLFKIAFHRLMRVNEQLIRKGITKTSVTV